ncbi:unnamed protein product [Adineta ricciae]|uniref:Uncharacterized protein n=1 Tax=Adineta ricciae TaxID=249248 RepID=A0A813WJR7_ADIRI|nr:unnamed protein product [Adineta ricciae]CAF1058829.1 unnamed protein product [Adineta ricciae]
MAKSPEVFNFKILVIGESSVGKSSLMTRFVDETFQATFIPTIGVDFKVRTIMIDNYQCKVQIWDTAGQERFRVITTTYYRDAAGVIVVYDVTNHETFSRVCRWLDEIKKYCDDNIIKVLVGNKADVISVEDSPVQKVVSTEQAQQYAQEMNIPFFETSAKDNKNVDILFHTIARLALDQRLQARQKSQLLQRQDLTNGIGSSQGIRLKGSKKKTSANCCK